MQVDWRVKALDAVMRRSGLTISRAPTVADVQRLRARRQLDTHPAITPLVRGANQLLFGRTHPDVTATDSTADTAEGLIAFRRYAPAGVASDAPLIVHLHGGGWVLGDLDGGDFVCSHVAAGLGAVVVSVDYRLAPEHPAPAGVRDVVAATRWAADHAADLGASGGLGVMGDSAGGNLAALAAIDARDTGGPTIGAQALIYPAVDLTMSFPSTVELADAPILTRVEMEAFRAHYLGDGGDPADPALSPWFVEDLAGLPPALVQTAEVDPLRDEGRAYADRLRDAGVATRWTQYADQPHGFVSLPGICPAANQAVAEIVQHFTEHLT